MRTSPSRIAKLEAQNRPPDEVRFIILPDDAPDEETAQAITFELAALSDGELTEHEQESPGA